jgi:cytochrome P450
MSHTVEAMDGVDLTDLDNFTDGFPHHLFARHRRVAPVWWHPPTQHTPDGEGFWSVATHAEVLEVLRDTATYSSETGGDRPYGGTLIQDLPVSGLVLNMMDDPRHARIRRLVSAGLTPKTIRRVEEDLRRRIALLLDDVESGEPVDFVREIAAEIPMQMICVLLGVPESERHWLFEAVEPGFDHRGDGATTPPVDHAALAARMKAFGIELIAEKRRNPADDMLSVVVHATLDDAEPNRLTDDELYMFFSLLFTAGSETTRNAIAGGVLGFARHQEQYAGLCEDRSLLSAATEESVRWMTPSPAKRRTATRRVDLGGHTIEPGDKVVVWEGSANRDETVFDDPDRFDLARDPNPHLGFGHGPHFCLGANLARLEIGAMFDELAARFVAIELLEPPEWTRSNRHTGLRHLHVRMAR